MDLHEHQAKHLLKTHGLPMPRGILVHTPAEAIAAAHELGGAACMVKAQILAGGRGQAGGVKLAKTAAAAGAAASALLGARLVTDQTGVEGREVRSVYVETHVECARELYMAILVDRSAGRVAIIAAAQGGAEIEDSVAQDPNRMRRLIIDPVSGLDEAAARHFAAELDLKGATTDAAVAIMAKLYEAFIATDASLIEINPLTLTPGGNLLAVDVKMTLDDNALFRHPELADLRDEEGIDPSELEAARHEMNYVQLGGDIGCMVNGAGLALATLDLIAQQGGEPADFMDVRPVATREQIATGFKLILANPKVKAILVNMFGGGIMRCDTLAEGIALAVRERGLRVPLIVRAAGTNREIAKKTLTGQGIPTIFAKDMADAARLAVQAAKQEAA